jgi:hypothetical protein
VGEEGSIPASLDDEAEELEDELDARCIKSSQRRSANEP